MTSLCGTPSGRELNIKKLKLMEALEHLYISRQYSDIINNKKNIFAPKGHQSRLEPKTVSSAQNVVLKENIRNQCYSSSSSPDVSASAEEPMGYFTIPTSNEKCANKIKKHTKNSEDSLSTKAAESVNVNSKQILEKFREICHSFPTVTPNHNKLYGYQYKGNWHPVRYLQAKNKMSIRLIETSETFECEDLNDFRVIPKPFLTDLEKLDHLVKERQKQSKGDNSAHQTPLKSKNFGKSNESLNNEVKAVFKVSKPKVEVENLLPKSPNSQHETLSCHLLSPRQNMNSELPQVICLYGDKTEENKYWVINTDDTDTYQMIQKELNRNYTSYKTIENPVEGLLCACMYGGEWFRAKVMSVEPKLVIHFVDYGNTQEYENGECRELPNALVKIRGLAKLVTFDKKSLLLLPNVMGSPIKVIHIDNEGSVPVLRLVSDSPDTTNEKRATTNNGPAVRKDKKSKTFKKSQTEENSSAAPKCVLDELKIGSKGKICFIPCHSENCGVIVPDEYSDFFQVDSDKKVRSDLIPIEAGKGDVVLVVDVDDKKHEAEVLEKVGSTYRVRVLSDCSIINVYNVYALERNSPMDFGVELKKKDLPVNASKACQVFFKVTDDSDPDNIECVCTKEKSDDTWHVRLRKPCPRFRMIISQIFLKSGTTVHISAFDEIATLYLQNAEPTAREALRGVHQRLQSYWRSATKTWSPPRNLYGYVGCVALKETAIVHRIRLTSSTPSNGEVNGILVDSGKVVDVLLDDIRALPKDLLDIPYFAVPVVVSKYPFSENVKNKLKEVIVKKVPFILTYDLYLTDIALRQKRRLPISESVDFVDFDFAEMEAMLTEKKVKHHAAPEPEEKPVILEDEIKWLSLKCGQKYELFVLHVDEKEFQHSCVFWATDDTSEAFYKVNKEMMTRMNEYCSTASESYSPRVSEVCLAKFEGAWYRALVLEKGNVHLIFFIDFGNVCRLDSSNLRKMKMEFLDAPGLALQFKIVDCHRLVGNPEMKKKVMTALQLKVNDIIRDAEICEYVNDVFTVRIPEIEDIIEE